MQKRLFLLVVTLLTLSLSAVAQVTTSGINGIVTANNEEVIGATITAKHVPPLRSRGFLHWLSDEEIH